MTNFVGRVVVVVVAVAAAARVSRLSTAAARQSSLFTPRGRHVRGPRASARARVRPLPRRVKARGERGGVAARRARLVPRQCVVCAAYVEFAIRKARVCACVCARAIVVIHAADAWTGRPADRRRSIRPSPPSVDDHLWSGTGSRAADPLPVFRFSRRAGETGTDRRPSAPVPGRPPPPS